MDVGEDGLLDLKAAEDAISTRTKAVIPVHLGGLTVDTGPLRALLPPGVRIVEDAAHALPADVGGVPTGRLGDAAAFSFYATKTMTTGGEGGMLVTNDASIAGRARRMRLHGISADSWNRYGAGGTWYYEVVEPGFKYNLTDLAAAIGLAQLERLDALAAQRAAIAAKYDAKFSGSDLLQVPPRRAGDEHAWHLYAVRLNLESVSIGRAEVIRRLADAGIGTSVHFIPLHLHPYYQRAFGYKPGDFPTAERIYEGTISLPIWPGMTDVQLDRVSDTLLNILSGVRRGKRH